MCSQRRLGLSHACLRITVNGLYLRLPPRCLHADAALQLLHELCLKAGQQIESTAIFGRGYGGMMCSTLPYVRLYTSEMQLRE